MGGCVITTRNRNIVLKVPIDRDKLQQIANILEISQPEREAILSEIRSSGESIHIYAGHQARRVSRATRGSQTSSGASSTTPGGGPSPSPRGGRAPPSPTRRRRPPSE